MQKQPPAVINEETLNGLLGRAITDFGATSLAALVVIGDRLGLYRVLADERRAHRRRAGRRRAARTSATCANGSMRMPPPAT